MGGAVAREKDMAIKTVPKKEIIMQALQKFPSRKAWLAARGMFGATAVPTIMGLNPWASPFALWTELKGISPRQDENRAMRRGKALERFIIGEYSEETGRAVKWTPNTLATRGILHASPDAICEAEDLLVEAKSSESADAWSGDAPPLYVQAQVQAQLWVMQAAAADVVALLPHDQLKTFRILPDEQIMNERILPAVHAFAESLKGEEPPWGQIDASDATRSALNTLWKARRVEGKIERVEALDGAVSAIRDAEAQVKSLTDIIEQNKNAVRAAIAERKCDGVEAGGFIYELKTVARKECTVAASESIQLKSRKLKEVN